MTQREDGPKTYTRDPGRGGGSVIRLLTALVVVMSTALPLLAMGQSPSLASVMRDKARNAQDLLLPLVRGDFAGIERFTERLATLTYTEVASWQDRPNSEYLRQATEFLAAIEGLGQAVEARDMTRATTSYGRLVASCVNCHQLVKATRSVKLVSPAPILDANQLQSRRH